MIPQSVTIHVDTWAAVAFTLGVSLPMMVASAAGGYILAGYVLERLGRTVLGTHIRHFFTRIAPAKRFNPSDYDYVRHILRTIKEKQQ